MKWIALIVVLPLMIVLEADAQDTTDAYRLSQLVYMDFADQVDCDSSSGSLFEARICLNLKFQKADSALNATIAELLKILDDTEVREQFITAHTHWIEERRQLCKFESSGYTGNMLGIKYLACFLEKTILRTRELEYHLREDE